LVIYRQIEEVRTELGVRVNSKLKQAVLEIVNADPSSQYYYKINKTDSETQLFLIERNYTEGYCICHCFSTDVTEDYAYESIPLTSVRTFYTMAEELGID